VVGIAAAVLSLTSSILLDLARLHDGNLVADSADIVRLGDGHAGLFRWSGLLDLLGSYLLFLPLAVYLRQRLHEAHPTAIDIGTVAAVVYGGVGAAGAAAWVGATPLITAYTNAPASEQPHVAVTFAAVLHVVAALWHYVAGPAAAVWFAAVAIAARTRWRRFAAYSAILATATGLASIGAALYPEATSSGPATLYFLPLAVWPAWLAAHVWHDDASRC
jgi:hypothetical protein